MDGEVAPLDMLTSIHDEDGIQKVSRKATSVRLVCKNSMKGNSCVALLQHHSVPYFDHITIFEELYH